MEHEAIQDHYRAGVAHCYGCGHQNDRGLRIRSFWTGEEAVCQYTAQPYHTGILGYAYGGLIASLIDCHACATASAAACQAEGLPLAALTRFVTGSLSIRFLSPTPLAQPIELVARVTETKGRKAVISVVVSSAGEKRVEAEVIALRMPENWLPEGEG